MGVARPIQISAIIGQRGAARWYFAGFDSPALDVRFSDLPPQSMGAILLPVRIAVGVDVEPPAEQERSFISLIERRYLDQGITPRDLSRMVADDFLRDLTIGEIRDRADEDIPEGSRGTLYSIQVVRTVDNTCVPIEPPL